MPIFEYRCERCGQVFDHLARTAADKPEKCPQCGAKRLKKQFASFSASVGASGKTSCSTGSCPVPTCSTGTCPFG